MPVIRRKSSSSVKMETPQVVRLADGAVVEDVVTLLSSPQCKFLVSGKGRKVPITFLKGKVVGLYFYTDDLNWKIFDDLTRMAEERRNNGERFELVFICIHLQYRSRSLEKEFNHIFKGTRLLALPFSQSSTNILLYYRFCLLCDPYEDPSLVIIRPRENIAHTHAMDIFRTYGAEAYPFSKSRLTEIEVARLKSLTLDSVLLSVQDYKFQIRASHLMGKNILFFMARQYDNDSDEKVIAWYNEIKHKHEAFEMIRVIYGYNHRLGEARKSYNGKMPWVEFPYVEDNTYALCEILLKRVDDMYNSLPLFVAFGRDGRFRSLKSLGSLIDCGKAENGLNIFDNVDLNGVYEEVGDYIARGNLWST